MDRLLDATAQAEVRHFWFRGFRYFVVPLLRQATQGLSDVRLLDCGCGTGHNVELLGRFGRAYGFDMNRAGLLAGRRAGRTRLVRASVAAVPFPSAFFDVVTSFDVLYALDSEAERAAVAEMHRLARPGGYVLVNVAAMDVLRGDHSVLSQELRRYSAASLRRLLSQQGLDIVRLTHTNASLFLPMLVARSLQRRRGLTDDGGTQEISVPWGPVNGLLTAVLGAESLWLRMFDSPVGSSLLCLARKTA